jgi:hypothetical protein
MVRLQRAACLAEAARWGLDARTAVRARHWAAAAAAVAQARQALHRLHTLYKELDP